MSRFYPEIDRLEDRVDKLNAQMGHHAKMLYDLADRLTGLENAAHTCDTCGKEYN